MDDWHIEGRALQRATAVAVRPSSAEARTCASDWRQQGYEEFTIRWRPSDDVEVGFDPFAPRVMDALRFLLNERPPLLGSDVANILGVTSDALRAALEPLRKGLLLDVMDHGTDREKWIPNGPGIKNLDDVLATAKRLGISVEVPISTATG